MARLPDKDIIELAETVNNLFEKEIFDPSVREIADAHFGGKALPHEYIEIIRKRLHRVRTVLETVYGHSISLLSETYYTEFRLKPPQDAPEAQRCIPVGGGNRAEGLRLQTTDDLIWQAMIQQGLATGNGKVKKQVNRVLGAVQTGRLQKPTAAHILLTSQQQARPDNRLLESEVIGLLETTEETIEENLL